MDKEQEINIELVHWSHTCADGCCYNSGTELHLDGEALLHPDGIETSNGYLGEDVETGLTAVLKKLGYNNIKITRKYEE